MTRRRDTEALSLPLEFRRAFEELRCDYDAAGTSRYLPSPRGVQLQGSGADYHYRTEAAYFRMMERARSYDRNNLVVGQGVNRLVANVVQDGFTLDPQTPDAGFNRELKARWYDWAEDPEQCDSEGEKSFCDLEQLVFRQQIVDGDHVLLLLADGTIQSVEAHRLKTPRGTKKNVVHGVELSDRGRRERYWISKRDIGVQQSIKLVGEVTQYPVRDEDGERQVLHCYFPWRSSQTRGVTALAPIAFPLNLHDDLQFAALVAAQVQSCWAILQENIPGLPRLPDPKTGGEAQTGVRTAETNADGTMRTTEGMSPGMRVDAPEGKTIRGFAPTIPGPQFEPHAMLVLTFISVNLDLPLAILLLDPTKTNFSGWRGAIDQARMRFRVWQTQYSRRLHVPVYRWKVRQWAAEDRAIKARAETMAAREFFAHVWNPPRWAYIEPLKDVQADSYETATCLSSRRRIKARRGEDWSEIVPELIDDNALLIEAAIVKAAAINARHGLAGGEQIHWRDLAALPMPDGVTLSMSGDTQPANEPAGKEAAA
jgi:lambda family phage portal protein